MFEKSCWRSRFFQLPGLLFKIIHCIYDRRERTSTDCSNSQKCFVAARGRKKKIKPLCLVSKDVLRLLLFWIRRAFRSVSLKPVQIQLYEEAQHQKLINNKRLGKTNACIIVFALDDEASFAAAQKFCTHVMLWMEKTVRVLVGTKSDVDGRKVRREEIKKLCSKMNMRYFEVSCKTGQGVDSMLEQTVIDCVQAYVIHPRTKANNTPPLSSEHKDKKKILKHWIR